MTVRKHIKILMVLLAVGLAVGLYGCGGSADGPTSRSSVPASQAVTDVPAPEPTPAPELKTHGLVIMEYDQPADYTVYCFDLETGEKNVISSFHLSEDDDIHARWSDLPFVFSSDFTKTVGEKTMPGDEHSHVGWFDTEGNFFDVTEALGLQAGNYRALGFSEDLFGYNSLRPSGYYYVPVDQVSPKAVQEGLAMVVGHPDGGGILYTADTKTITDWLDDTRCIVNAWPYLESGRSLVSEIVDMESRTVINYIPDDFELSWTWNGVLSPDGTQIAFMAQEKRDGAKTDIYIMPVNGGRADKLECHPFELRSPHVNASPGCTLIGWI